MAIKTEPKLRKADRIVGQTLAALGKVYERPDQLTKDVLTSQRAPSVAEANMRSGRPHSGKRVVSIRLDPEVLAKFQATGRGWQARMNDALRKAKP